MEKESLPIILNRFWEWINLTPQLYATASRAQGAQDLNEYLFPSWEKMISEAFHLIDKSPEDERAIDAILTAMAIDNEGEGILDYIAQNGSEMFINKFIELGVAHGQPHARWQCAELIRRRKPSNGERMLLRLMLDPDDYVRKRAQNAMDSQSGG